MTFLTEIRMLLRHRRRPVRRHASASWRQV